MTWWLRFVKGWWDIGMGVRNTPRTVPPILPWTYSVWRSNRQVGRAIFIGPRFGVWWVHP